MDAALSGRPRRAERWTLPSLCAICHGWGPARICAACIARYAAPRPRCRRCALPVEGAIEVCGTCLTDPPPYRRTIAALDYAQPWDRLIAHFKFHGALELAPALARRLAEAARADDDPGLLLPIPLSPSRLRERGYNQAWEITRRIARSWGAPADARLLLRVRDTPHQLAFPPAERAANVRAAFAVEPRRSAELAGRRVTLVDDVMTTGATATEAARTLLRAGASDVCVWVVARTPRPNSLTSS